LNSSLSVPVMIKPISELNHDELFSGSWAKVARAANLIEELERELKRYLESKPAQVVGYVRERNAIEMKIVGTGLLPGAIFGDIIHNLRSSLDLMACELARLNKISDKDVYFPTGADDASLTASPKYKHFKRVGADALAEFDLIARHINGGAGKSIRAMHDLDIEDKHKALVPIGSKKTIGVRMKYDVNDPGAGSFQVDVSNLRYEFPAGHFLAGQDLIDTAKNFLETVEKILSGFEQLVARRAANGLSPPY